MKLKQLVSNSVCCIFSEDIFFSDCLTLKVLNTTIAECENTVDPDEMAHYEPSHLDLKCLPPKL